LLLQELPGLPQQSPKPVLTKIAVNDKLLELMNLKPGYFMLQF
jgi:hypothetical protein